MITLDAMTGLARALLDADEAVGLAEADLKTKVETARVLREETIPGAMQELGLTQIKLSTGQTVDLKSVVYASIPAANKEEAFAWLAEHGFDGLIKTDVSITWGREALKNAVAFFKRIRKKQPQAELIQAIHPQTLKAFVGEQLAKGAELPMDTFGARAVFEARITKQKVKT